MVTFKRFIALSMMTLALVSCSKKAAVNAPQIPANGNKAPTDDTASSSDPTGGLAIAGTWSTGCISLPGDSSNMHIFFWDFSNGNAQWSHYQYDIADTSCSKTTTDPNIIDYTYKIGTKTQAGNYEFNLIDSTGVYYDILSWQTSSTGTNSFLVGDDYNTVGSNDGSTAALRISNIDPDQTFKPYSE
jgi:hypothetical protein